MIEMPSDPAVIAAKRAWDDTIVRGGRGPNENPWLQSIAAASEALKPIRTVLDKLAADTEPPCGLATRIQLFEKAISDLSPLVFATEELER